MRRFLENPLSFCFFVFLFYQELIYSSLTNGLIISNYQCEFWKNLFINNVLVFYIHAVIEYFNKGIPMFYQIVFFLKSGPNILIIYCLIIYGFEIKNLFIYLVYENYFFKKV